MNASERKNKFWAYASKWADRTVVFSFDKVGYFIHQHNFDANDLDHSMQKKVCLITGGSSGIGRATAKALAEHGAEVYILCRNQESGLVAVDELREETKNHHIHLAAVDVSDLDSIQKFLKTFAPKRVDVLIHNAGSMASKKKVTRQGAELTFATSVLGPYLLTMGLLDKMQDSPDARVIFVSSGGAYTQKLEIDKLLGNSDTYNGLIAYAQSKRAQIILAEIFAEKLRHTSVSVHAMHPGWVNTPGVRKALPKFHFTMQHLLRTPQQGADTAVWLAVCPTVKNQTGKYWFDRMERNTHFMASTQESQKVRQILWNLCVERCALLVSKANSLLLSS